MRYEVSVLAFSGSVVLAADNFLTFAEEKAFDLLKDFEKVWIDDVVAGRPVVALERREHEAYRRDNPLRARP